MPFTIIAHGNDGKHRVEESAIVESADVSTDCWGDKVTTITLRVSPSLMHNADYSVKKTTRKDSVDVLDNNPLYDAAYYKGMCDHLRESRDKKIEDIKRLINKNTHLVNENTGICRRLHELERELKTLRDGKTPMSTIKPMEAHGTDPVTFTVMCADIVKRSYEVRAERKWVRARFLMNGDVSGFQESNDGNEWVDVPLGRVFQAPHRNDTEKAVGVLQDKVEKMAGLVNRTARVLSDSGVEWEGDLEDCAKAVVERLKAELSTRQHPIPTNAVVTVKNGSVTTRVVGRVASMRSSGTAEGGEINLVMEMTDPDTVLRLVKKHGIAPAWHSDEASAMRVREQAYIKAFDHFLDQGSPDFAVSKAVEAANAAVAAFQKASVL